MNKSIPSLSFAAAAVAALALFSNAEAKRSAESVPGEIIVGLRDDSSSGYAASAPGSASARGSASGSSVAQAALRSALVQILGANSVAEVKSLQMDASIQKITLRDPTQTRAAITQLTNALAGTVRYAEPNYIYHADVLPSSPIFEGEPNDTDFAAKQWDMKNTGQIDKPDTGQTGAAGSDINVLPLWRAGMTGSRNLLVAIIDTGMDYNHRDLAANAFKNIREIAGNGVDDDSNGVVDDVYGANFVSGTGVGNGLDDQNHGTHCAGTIGAVGNDANGISGVNWAVSMMPSKFLDANGSGSLEGAVNAIKYATRMGAKVMSNSWGGGGFSQALKDAILEANSAGALFIAAAGNDGVDNDSDPHYPSSYDVPNMISVAASDNRDAIASFSNYGRRSVHVTAPGKNIYSTVKGGGYAIYSGTSMATPHVSGIAALIWGANPRWTAAEVKERLIRSSTPISALRRKTVSGGRVNAANAANGVYPARDEPADSAWRNVSYAVESAHPYVNNANATFEISAPGARYIRVVFDRIETESNYDFLTLESATGEVIEQVSGTKAGEYVTDYIRADRAVVRLRTDSSENRFGFKVSKIQIVE